MLIHWLLTILAIPVFAAVPGSQGSDARGKLITVSAGRVGDTVVTSREVLANSLIEDTLYRVKREKKLYLKAPRERTFVQETTAVLLENAIAQEAKDLPVAKVSITEIQKARDTIAKKLKSQKYWRDLAVSDAELEGLLKNKMSAKKFLEFKVEAAGVPITDNEAETYYKNNRFKFDNATFDVLKENIKAYLRKKQVDDRLREWFEVLKIKYSIRNQLAEKGAF